MNDKSDKPLVQHSKETYGDDFNAHLLEQYKLYVQSADNVSARRIASSRYLLTINVALIAIFGVDLGTPYQSIALVFAPGIGVLVSLVWLLIIRSSKRMNTVKFEIIHKLEQLLPASLYEYEWQKLQKGKFTSYVSVTDIEQWVPIMFFGVYVVLYIMTFPVAINGFLDSVR